MVGARGGHRAALPECGQRQASVPAGRDASGARHAVGMEPERPGHGELPVRDAHSARRFAGLGIEALPDETTILNFRRRLERADLGEPLFDRINAVLAERGTRLSTGTLVDASFVEAPSSTKNRKGERDPEMRQGRKGKTWHFGMKAHIGVDAESGLVHSLSTTPANESDVVHAHEVLHGGETDVWGDSGYQGVGKRPENRDKAVEWRIALKRGVRKLLDRDGPEEAAEREKGSKRARVEHPFLRVKVQFGYGKVRYRGLAKNTQRLFLLFGLANLLTADGPAAA